MTVCWIYACREENGCDTSTLLGCYKNPSRSITFLNNCTVNTTNFGIFATILHTDIPESTDFIKKLSNCFCWGLQNLRFVYLIPFIMPIIKLSLQKKITINFQVFGSE